MTTPLKGRLMKVETSLTPKQAVLLWLQDARQQSLDDYTLAAFNENRTARDVVSQQIHKAIRESMKGKADRELIDKAVHQAVRDGDLLVCLVIEANTLIRLNARADALQAALLLEQMRGILETDSASNELMRVFAFLVSETAYPLDPDTAAAYDFVRDAWVHDRDAYRYDSEEWVKAFFIGRGKTRIPPDAMTATGSRRPLTDDELLPIFADPNALASYRAGTDHNHELADVTDADFDAQMAAVDAAFDALVANGTLLQGVAVDLALPSDATYRVPLLDGVWIDRYLVELAEWHATLEGQGFIASQPDGHDVAWHEYRRPAPDGASEGSPATADELDAARQSVHVRMKTFTGKTRTHQGRAFWSFDDYRAWKARACKSLKTVHGFTAASWRAWMAAQGPTAALADVPVAPFDVMPRLDYIAVADPKVRQQKQQIRRGLFDRIRPWLVDKNDVEGAEYIEDRKRDAAFAAMMPFGMMGFKTRIADWRVRAMAHASEVYRLKAAIDRVQTKYFDGQPILFPDIEQDLQRQMDLLQTVTDIFNETVARRLQSFTATELLTGETPSPADDELPAPWRTGFDINLAEVAELIEPYIDARVGDIETSARVKMLESLGDEAAVRRVIRGRVPKGAD